MTQPPGPGATRRTFLAGAGVAGLAAGGGAAAEQRAGLDLQTPQGRLRAYMQMRGALDDRLVIGFVTGRYYGVVDEEMRPLYGVAGATFARYRLRADGGYDAVSYEVAYFTDLKTGSALDTWINPYTGERVDVPATNLPPARLVITPDLKITMAKTPPGVTSDNGVVSSQVAAPDVWITEETHAKFTPPGASKAFHYGEIVSLYAPIAAFADPNAKRVPCQTAYTSVVSWRPWLKMGDRPGHLLGNGSGRYARPWTSCRRAGLKPQRSNALMCLKTQARRLSPYGPHRAIIPAGHRGKTRRSGSAGRPDAPPGPSG